jgi:2-(1,2-epoxy-1,2-dihydrophenyl)acetyl-CoA isomerase
MAHRGAQVEEWDAAGLQYGIEDGVAWLRMNRPHKRNAIDRPLRTALLEAIHEVSEDPGVKVAVITGNGSAFSAGADLTQEGGPIEVPPERRMAGPNAARHDGILYGWYRLMEAIWHSDTPFIAAVNGVAAGGGCQLALACDLILASEEASFWEVFVRRGLPLEGGGAWILPRAVSLVRAKEMALFGEPLPAARAEEWGLINRCVPAADLEDTAREWARKLATLGPPGGGPGMPGAPEGAPGPDLSVRVGHIKSQLNQALEATMNQSFRDEVTFLGLGGGPPGGGAPGGGREGG